ncbi:putative glycosyltransferase CsbB [Lachnospiraceae bacterium]|jgi:glycosyltransferase involved in cell wall biosynthesis|nr:glycosyltransferase family 2 protein [Eubacterium sp.]GFI26475.1 putative glycosyltransferase CsbB [Lachnospiraceae bacterium]
MKLTAIIPCYNEESALRYFYEEMERVMRSMPQVDFELLFVNDGSKDNTLEQIKALSVRDERVKYISFSRNFGKEAAIYAGLEHSDGDLTAIMDADLQDPPSLLPRMYQAIVEEGYDSVATRRVNRKGEPPIRSFFARNFYRLMNRISKTDIVDGARDYRLMNRAFVNALLEMGEYNRFSKGLFGWVGFETKWLEFENVERVAGETKWSFWKLFLYSIDGIVAFSTMPLSIAAFFGVMMCLVAAGAILFIIIRQLLYGGSAFGWPSMVCIIMFLGGIQLLCMGILGSYLAKTYLEVKKRPIYICKETNLSGRNGERDE